MWPNGEMKLLSDQVLDRVDAAEACGGHANLEQHFTDAPWKMALLTHAINQTRKIGSCWRSWNGLCRKATTENGLLNFWNGSFSREMYGRPTVVFCRSERDA